MPLMNTDDYPLSEESYQIIGACMNVHNELGAGFMEAVYQEALVLELHDLLIPFVREKILDIYYKGYLLEKKYKADFICFDQIIVELKAVNELNSEHTAQALNYLKATGMKLALLVNFGKTRLQYKRVIR
ncbi:GxxExxY protein [Gaoshiqia sediminis]|uniref:GxxExxY protein n=1 Tax=Gaoshiqia sediminis TaxID=2986998 RepID=A0AA41Y943_9BACT|nr:GxxExxY protein [Gaoshiqia sediminis]MCW0484374.1 GxxExxY protein [Gaoshiqia sediminis]